MRLDGPMDNQENGAIACSSVEIEPVALETISAGDATGEPRRPTTAQESIDAGPDVIAYPIIRMKGITEIRRSGATGKIASWQPVFEVQRGSESSFEAICESSHQVQWPLDAMMVPTGPADYTSTDALFGSIQTTICAHTGISEQASALLSYWIFASWCSDALCLAPVLVISGAPQEGDSVLRVLRALSHYGFLMTGISPAAFRHIPWAHRPTILSFEQSLSKSTAALLACGARRGYLTMTPGWLRDFYGPKAIYAVENLADDLEVSCSIHVNCRVVAGGRTSRFPDSAFVDYQNQLLAYRVQNLVAVQNATYDAVALPREMRPVANALAASIVDSPSLQHRLVSLLTPLADERQADMAATLEGLTFTAILGLYHRGQTECLVAGIANEVNSIAKSRGERSRHSPETVGHALKRLGIYTRRLSKAGKGLTLDRTTMIRIHELAHSYGAVGFEQDDESECSLCAEIRRLG